jgi:hypothetical protein
LFETGARDMSACRWPKVIGHREAFVHLVPTDSSSMRRLSCDSQVAEKKPL